MGSPVGPVPDVCAQPAVAARMQATARLPSARPNAARGDAQGRIMRGLLALRRSAKASEAPQVRSGRAGGFPRADAIKRCLWRSTRKPCGPGHRPGNCIPLRVVVLGDASGVGSRRRDGTLLEASV